MQDVQAHIAAPRQCHDGISYRNSMVRLFDRGQGQLDCIEAAAASKLQAFALPKYACSRRGLFGSLPVNCTRATVLSSSSADMLSWCYKPQYATVEYWAGSHHAAAVP